MLMDRIFGCQEDGRGTVQRLRRKEKPWPREVPETCTDDRNAGCGMELPLATRRGTVTLQAASKLAAVGWRRLGNAQRCKNKGRQAGSSKHPRRKWPEAMVYFKARACKIYIYAMCTRPSFLVKGMCCGAS